MAKIVFLFGCHLALLAAVIVLPACDKKKNESATNTPAVNGKTYLALGDSYTIGQSVQPDERFPHLAVASLRQQGVAFRDPQYIATTGWTTADLLNAIDANPVTGTYDVVTLLIGVNDQYRGLDTAGYRSRFTQLLNKAVGFAGNRVSRVFVLSIPDYSATPFVAPSQKARVRKEVDEFNVINKQVTLQNNVAYIDITPLSREAASDPSLLAGDGLHYSAKEHQKWAELLVPLVKSAVQ